MSARHVNDDSAEVRGLDAARKSWNGMVARFCLAGYQLDRITGGAGFRIARGLWSVDLPDVASVAEFARRAGIALPEAPS